ncbi:hypothetical protein ACRZ6S_005291, partial [Citrobacter freundii]
QVSHRGSAIKPAETLDFPAQVSGSPPGFGVQESDLRRSACTGRRASSRQVKIAALFIHQLMR